jgi:hypothetical protein
MKRLLPLLIFLLLCSFSQTSSARMNAYIAGSVASASGACTCGTASNSCTDDPVDPQSMAFCYYADRIGLSQQFTSASSQTVCKASLRMKRDGTVSNNPTLQVCIYTDSSNEPGTQVGTCSTNTLNVNDLTTSFADVEFTGLSATLSASTNYHITLIGSAQCTGDVVRWGMADSGCSVDSLYYGFWSGTEWTAQTQSFTFEYTLTQCN